MKIDFLAMQENAMIKDLKLNKYAYIIKKVNEYIHSKYFSMDEAFKETYISFYDMQKQCFIRQENKKKQRSIWGEKFFIYFERLIQEQAKNNQEFKEFNKEAEEKLREIIYVLSIIEEINDEDLRNNKNLKIIASEKMKTNEIKTIYKSFATKLFATLNPNMPIWDNNVIQNIKFKLSDKANEIIKKFKNNSFDDKTDTNISKVDDIIIVYKEIYDEERKMLKEATVKNEIDNFKKFFISAKENLKQNKYKIKTDNDEYCDLIDKLCVEDLTEIKILDFFLWKE